jgi:transcriptional regulator with XRE-family HTH domain
MKEPRTMKIYSYRGKKNLCGDKIREARLKQRLSQSDLAAKIQIEGVTLERDSISRIEIGTRFVTDYELKIFARVLRVNVGMVIGRKRRITPGL